MTDLARERVAMPPRPAKRLDGFLFERTSAPMETSGRTADTLFIVKDGREHCFLFDRDDPLELLRALLIAAEKPDSGLTREEAYEVMEGMMPERLRAI